ASGVTVSSRKITGNWPGHNDVMQTWSFRGLGEARLGHRIFECVLSIGTRIGTSPVDATNSRRFIRGKFSRLLGANILIDCSRRTLPTVLIFAFLPQLRAHQHDLIGLPS